MSVRTSVCVHCVGEDARSRFRELGPALTGDATSMLLTEGNDGDGGAHLVLFERFDSSLCELLMSVAEQGQRRVLAIAMTPEALAGSAPWQLLRLGVSEVLAWDRPEQLSQRIACRIERWRSVDDLVATDVVRKNAVGRSRVWVDCLRQIVEVAAFGRGHLLVTGESGTGKELVARLVHALDRRPDKGELVVLDCTTVVPSLSGSEFFGHERGAFTGALGARDGAFALAHRGTLFLDEVGELPASLQAQLLRVVQENTYKRVGGNTWHQTQFRLICATNRALDADIESGSFRSDLFYRIAQDRCHLPPLRERRDDVLALAAHFLGQLLPLQEPDFDPLVARFLLERPFPGNVRELRHLVGRIATRHVGEGPISVGDLPFGDLPLGDLPEGAANGAWPDSAVEAMVQRALSAGIGLKELGRVTSDTAIRLALEAEGGNLQRAARLLKVTDRALQMRRAQGAA